MVGNTNLGADRESSRGVTIIDQRRDGEQSKIADTPDADLVQGIQRGDQAAFTALVRRWENAVLRIAFRITDDLQEAEDVRQTVFLRLLESSAALRQPEQFAAWVRRSTINAAISVLRRQKRRQTTNAGFQLPSSSNESTQPDQLAAAAEEAKQLGVALIELEPAERALLSLRFDEALSFDEIATVLGQPVSTVKSRAARAVRRLRSLLGNSERVRRGNYE